MHLSKWIRRIGLGVLIGVFLVAGFYFMDIHRINNDQLPLFAIKAPDDVHDSQSIGATYHGIGYTIYLNQSSSGIHVAKWFVLGRYMGQFFE